MFVGNSCFFLELSKLKYALSHTKEASKPKLDWNVLFCNWHVVHSIVIYAKIKLLRNHQLSSLLLQFGVRIALILLLESLYWLNI